MQSKRVTTCRFIFNFTINNIGEIESWLREEKEALLEPLAAELGRADRADDTIHSMHGISGGVSPTLDRLMRQQSEMANRMAGKVKKSED